MEKLCNYLDVRSISKLEQCCHLLRDLVVENKIYRRKVSAAIRGGGRNTGGWLRKSVTDPTDLEMSNFFKKKLLQNTKVRQKLKYETRCSHSFLPLSGHAPLSDPALPWLLPGGWEAIHKLSPNMVPRVCLQHWTGENLWLKIVKNWFTRIFKISKISQLKFFVLNNIRNPLNIG